MPARSRQGDVAPSSTPGGVIAAVSRGSIAEEVEIQPGDRLMAINGHPVHDILDVRFYGAEEELTLVTRRDGRELVYEIERGYDETLGLEFKNPTFDGIRRCQCRCTFCFVQQMAPGQRRSLYIRDDDFRYSFLFGNFVTLTNLTRRDWARIGEQHLSPLYVSVHTTDHDLRRQMLGNPRAPEIMAQLQGLGEMGIQIHTQIVLVPGMNDGEILETTLDDLASLYPMVQSVAIVPVGLTRFHRRGLQTVTPSQAQALIAQVAPRQIAYREEYGVNLVYLSDEIYLLAGMPIPPTEVYDGFPQLENGVGLTRQLLDEWEALQPRLDGIQPSYREATLVCGTLIAPVLWPIVASLNETLSLTLTLVPVTNRFFGTTVSVSGLLTGQDVVAALHRLDLGEWVVLPRVMFDDAGARTLDGLTRAELADQLGARVALVTGLEDLLTL